jgi:hypothetical protein
VSEESIDFGIRPPAETPVFVAPDADASADATVEGLVDYCPTSHCPAGHTTCTDSIFPCDVDLKSDPRNCGACGASCPAETGGEFFSCLEGKCVMTCKEAARDCDGLIETGCEVFTEWDNANCGGCGITCNPGDYCFYSQCGLCTTGQTFCENIGQCVQTQIDDENCRVCGNVCDPVGDGSTPPPNMYFGCLESTCGKRKCKPGWADCDNDKTNGCERKVGTDTDCAACDDSCLAQGETCLKKPFPESDRYCGCPAGQSFCGTCDSPGGFTVQLPDGGTETFPLPAVCTGYCYDLTNDQGNCGACGQECKDGTCEYGSCIKQCPFGRADCDGNPDCEVNTQSDPSNCGGCGITCNAVAGQACVGGKCVVEPCDAGAGGPTR